MGKNNDAWHEQWEAEYREEDDKLIADVLSVILNYHNGDMAERASDLVSDLHTVLFERLWEHHCYVSGSHRDWTLKLRRERGRQKDSL